MTTFGPAAAFATGNFIALNGATRTAGLDLGVFARTPVGPTDINLIQANAASTNSDATADAASFVTGLPSVQAGILGGSAAGTSPTSFTAGRNSLFDVRQFGRIEAFASAPNGNASAEAGQTGNLSGGILNIDVNSVLTPIVKAGGELFSNTLVNNFVRSGATSTGGDASATTQPGQSFGQLNVGTLVGTNAQIYAQILGQGNTAPANFEAIATTGTGDATATIGAAPNPVDPTLSGPRIAAIYGSGEGDLVYKIGANGVISGVAGTQNGAIKFDSQATTTTGDATAQNQIDGVGGIGVGLGGPASAGGLAIEIGGSTTGSSLTPPLNFVQGWGFGDSEATAKTTTGSATADSLVQSVGGIVDGAALFGKYQADGSYIKIGAAGSVDGAAGATGRAEATTTSGGAQATSNANYVVGIALGGRQDLVNPIKPGIAIGAEGWIQSNAASNQTAIASNVGGAGDPTALAGNGDVVVGQLNTDATIGGNLSRFAASGVLNATAIATATTDPAGSFADAGIGSTSRGLLNSDISVGGNLGATVANPSTSLATNDIFSASSGSNLRATATAVTGPVESRAGGSDPLAVPPLGEATSAAIDNSDIKVGLSGFVEGVANSSLSSTASTTNGTANATSGLESRGITASDITIGSGDFFGAVLLPPPGPFGYYTIPGVTGAVHESGVYGSSSVGSTATATGSDLATSDNTVDSIGIDLAAQIPGNSIKIGQGGNVIGASALSGGSTATATGLDAANDATASATQAGTGLLLGDRSVVSIGQRGSILGSSSIGSGAAPFVVAATANGGDATINTDFAATGIDASATGAVLQAGTLFGNINGAASVIADLDATSALGNAVTNTTTTTIQGINLGTNTIQAGLSLNDPFGPSSVTGQGVGNFTVNAKGATNAATVTASNDVDVFGINGGSIKVGGFNNTTGYTSSANPTVLATAFLSNVVTAENTLGAATATATGSAIGLNNTSVNILGSGTIVASSQGQIIANA